MRQRIRVALPFCHVRLKTPKPLPAAYPSELKTLGDHLRKHRLNLGLYQKDVARILAVNTATIYNWENNYSQPAIKSIPRIIKFLGCDPLPKIHEGLPGCLKALRRKLGLSQNQLLQ